MSKEALLGAVEAETPVEEVAFEEALAALRSEYPVGGPRGFEMAEVDRAWFFRSNRRYRAALEALFELGAETRLSQAAYETLAVVAYLQPVTRRDISEVRGVSSESSLRTLLERDLVREAGHSEQVGRPNLYMTTQRFLRVFGLGDLEHLQPLEGFALSAEEREEIRRRLGVMTREVSDSA